MTCITTSISRLQSKNHPRNASSNSISPLRPDAQTRTPIYTVRDYSAPAHKRNRAATCGIGSGSRSSRITHGYNNLSGLISNRMPVAANPIRTAGRRAFSQTAPVAQRHAVDRHHLKANLRSSTGWVCTLGQVEWVITAGPDPAGKSTLAARRGEMTGLPVIELDKHVWRPGRNSPRPVGSHPAPVRRAGGADHRGDLGP